MAMVEETNKRGFASDNNSGVHPQVMKEIINVNSGHVVGYGGDRYTEEAIEMIRGHLGQYAEIYFVFTGTAANVLGIAGTMNTWNSVITANTAHIETDECGAPEKFAGSKILTVNTPDGKLRPEYLQPFMHDFGFEHHSQPGLISISQTTEMGTLYTVEEIRALADYAHENGLLLHIDGARIANAAVALELPFKAFTTDAGADILSFGGTKNGMMYGEAVCFLRPGLAEGFKYLRKQGMQLASKMRFIAAQYIAYLTDDLWKECATHSNLMARELEQKLSMIEGIKITQEVQSNGIFVIIPSEVAERLRKQYFFYPWNAETSEYRLMTSWDTSQEDIVRFTKLLAEMMAGEK